MLALGALVVSPVQAAFNWNFTYNDVVNNTNVGFDDPTFGAPRRATFEAVANYVSSTLDGSGTIDFTLNNSQTDGGGALASAGTLYFTSPNGFSNGILFQHASTGTDPLGGTHDGSATFDFGYNWNSETDAPAGSEFDLYTVSLHELTHALGFASLADANGDSQISGGNPGVYGVFDSFLERGDGTALFSTTGGATFEGTAGDLTSEDVFFDGPNARASNGGQPIKMYAPSPYEPGSSISHIDSSLGFAVMTPSIAPGVEKRTYSAQDLGILQDVGWTVAPELVPEPSGTALLALGAVVLFVRRRRVV